MERRNIIIIALVAALIVIGVVAYLLFPAQGQKHSISDFPAEYIQGPLPEEKLLAWNKPLDSEQIYISNMGAKAICKDTGREAEKVEFYSNPSPPGVIGGWSFRYAYVCGDKYWIVDAADSFGTKIYGPFEFGKEPITAEPEIQVETDKSSYVVGEDMKITVRNNSEQTVWIVHSVYGCLSSFFLLQRKTEGDWAEIYYDVLCEVPTFRLIPLNPGEEKSEILLLDERMFPRGKHTYRIAVPYWQNKPFEGKLYDYQKAMELINKASKAYSKEFTIESFAIEGDNIVKTCSSNADCSWVSTNCCPESAGAHWECINSELSKLDCPTNPICLQVISPKPEKACICENGLCTAK